MTLVGLVPAGVVVDDALDLSLTEPGDAGDAG